MICSTQTTWKGVNPTRIGEGYSVITHLLTRSLAHKYTHADIGDWDTSSGTNFQNMFSRASAFNQGACVLG